MRKHAYMQQRKQRRNEGEELLEQPPCSSPPSQMIFSLEAVKVNSKFPWTIAGYENYSAKDILFSL